LAIKTEPPDNRTTSELPPHEYGIMFKVEDNFWWYKGMRHHLETFLTRYWDWQNQPNPLVLDAGCGTGAVLERLTGGFDGHINTKNAYGFDISPSALSFCQQRGLEQQIVRGSITAIPYTSQTFDIVTSFDVLSYVEDVELGFREVGRVLKHQGLAIINLPAYQWLYSEHDIAVNTLRRFNKNEVVNLLAQAGMRVERITYVNSFLFPPAAAIRLLKRRQLGKQAQVHSDLTPPHPLINNTLTKIMSWEAKVLAKTQFNLPFGLSVLALARKM
jgi:ubiquinone/menaquinone biosynthesis C-methylase UbiE